MRFKKIGKKSKKLLKITKANILLIISLIFLLPIFYILYQTYIPRINEFGCFDDCNNFMRGYFVLQGKQLFTEVFSGHQPLGSYLSTVIQFITNPQNIYELILRHRQFLLLFGLVFNALIIIRFGAKFIIFTLIFEFSKFYLFGDRFLGDGMIVYVFIYLIGLIFLKYKKQKIYDLDYILAAVFTWFIIFMREPYIPAAMIVYFIFLWSRPIRKMAKVSFILFLLLSAVTVFAHDVGEYFFNVVTFNFQVNLPAEVESDMFGHKILHWFFYPVYTFFYGPSNIFKSLLIALSFLYISLFLNLLWNKKYLLAGFIFLILGLLNIRTVMPGLIFYSAFHMIVWYGLLVFIIIELLFQKKEKKLIFIPGILILLISFALFISSPTYFGRIKTDTHEQFLTNFGSTLQEGEVINALSDPDDTMFLDGSEDLIYWQAKIKTSYKYSWYTSSMPFFKKYTDERIRMFKINPPDFYREYGQCYKPKGYVILDHYKLPDFVKDEYVRLYSDKPSCLYVHKNKISEITESQFKKAAEFQYFLPD